MGIENDCAIILLLSFLIDILTTVYVLLYDNR